MKKRKKVYVFFRRDGKLTENDKMMIPVLKARGIKVIVKDYTEKRQRPEDKLKVAWFDEASQFHGGDK